MKNVCIRSYANSIIMSEKSYKKRLYYLFKSHKIDTLLFVDFDFSINFL